MAFTSENMPPNMSINDFLLTGYQLLELRIVSQHLHEFKSFLKINPDIVDKIKECIKGNNQYSCIRVEGNNFYIHNIGDKSFYLARRKELSQILEEFPDKKEIQPS